MEQKKWIRSLVSVAALLALQACGGGSSTGSTTTTGSTGGTNTNTAQAASGTVTGFGSIIVDGQRIDDSSVAAKEVGEDGVTLANAELKMGQSVDVNYTPGTGNATSTAQQVIIHAAALGKVDAMTSTSLTVLGETININTDPTAGPVTTFGGTYTQWSDIQAGASVKVFGVVTSSGVMATRIEPATIVQYERLEGPVHLVDAQHVQIGTSLIDITNTTLIPQVTLREGMRVRAVFEPSVVTQYQQSQATTGIPAKWIRAKAVEQHRFDDVGGTVKVSDIQMTSNSSTQGSFVLNGITVQFDLATVILDGNVNFQNIMSGQYSSANGSVYLRVQGTMDSTGTVLTAKRIAVRAAETDLRHEGQELHGTVSQFTSNASFDVRGIAVDASLATINYSQCPTGTTALADGLQIEVKGVMSASGVLRAKSVKCEGVEAKSVIEGVGVVSSVDTANSQFTVTRGNRSITVNYTDKTLFVDVDTSTLNGSTVRVDGILTVTPPQTGSAGILLNSESAAVISLKALKVKKLTVSVPTPTPTPTPTVIPFPGPGTFPIPTPTPTPTPTPV